ncbi:MAG: hypothetical protein ACE5QW_02325 [Thermoplasmata archaeon]
MKLELCLPILTALMVILMLFTAVVEIPTTSPPGEQEQVGDDPDDILSSPQDYERRVVKVHGILRSVSDNSQTYLQDGSSTIMLQSSGTRFFRSKVNANVYVEGRVVFNSGLPILEVLDIQETGSSDLGTRGTEVSGPQTLLLILVRFQDHPNTRWTSNEIDRLVFENFTAFWNEASYGIVPSFSGDTTPWYDLSMNEADYYVPATADEPAHCCVFHNVTQEAVNLADEDGWNLRSYERLMVIFNINFRGLGTRAWTYSTSHGDVTISSALVGENPVEPDYVVWGRNAHEMGHEFGWPHVTLDYNNPYALMARLYPGHPMSWTTIRAGWLPPSNIATVERDSSGEFVVRPLELDLPGDIQVIKVVVSETFYYLVEVRKYIGFDNPFGPVLSMPDEGVLIYEVDERRTAIIDDELREIEPIVVLDSKHGTDTLDDAPFDVDEDCGGSYWPGCTPHNIEIRVVEEVGNGYMIRVFNDLTTNVPDVKIDDWGDPPGSPPPWETEAIWIDSYANGFNYYRYNDGDPRNPVGNGDDPWLGHMNRLYARVENQGGSTAFSARVNFYENIPIGIGDRGDWNLIDYAEITLYSGDIQDVYVEWTPIMDTMPDDIGILSIHSCIKVEIEAVPGEVDTANQRGRENIAHFESVPGSNFTPANTTFLLTNPLPRLSEMQLILSNIPQGWRVELEQTNFILDSHETVEVAISVTPALTTDFGDYAQIEITAFATNPSPSDDIHVIEIGGITMSVNPTEEVTIDIDLDRLSIREGEVVTVTGGTTPMVASQPLVLEAMAPNKTSTLIPLMTRADGTFDVPFSPPTDGDWTLRVLFAGNATISSGMSEKRVLEVLPPPPEAEPWTPSITILAISVVASLVIGAAIGYLVKRP